MCRMCSVSVMNDTLAKDFAKEISLGKLAIGVDFALRKMLEVNSIEDADEKKTLSKAVLAKMVAKGVKVPSSMKHLFTALASVA